MIGCANCNYDGWVCEDHLSISFMLCPCGGAGVPCPECNPNSHHGGQDERRIRRCHGVSRDSHVT